MYQKELSRLFLGNAARFGFVLDHVPEPIDSIHSGRVEPVLRAIVDIDIVIPVISQCPAAF